MVTGEKKKEVVVVVVVVVEEEEEEEGEKSRAGLTRTHKKKTRLSP